MRTPLTLLFLFVSLITFSQETTKVENTINNQFDEIYRISSSYQTYKVISKERYQKLKQNVLDSIKSSKRLISEKERLLVTEKNSINETKLLLDKTKKELDSSLKKENSYNYQIFIEEEHPYSKTELLDIQVYKNSLFKLKKPKIYESYQRYLKSYHLKDFDDILIDFYKMMNQKKKNTFWWNSRTHQATYISATGMHLLCLTSMSRLALKRYAIGQTRLEAALSTN